MANYDIFSGSKERQRYNFFKASPISYGRNQLYLPRTSGMIDHSYHFKPGEFPIAKGLLPNIFSAEPYNFTEMIQEQAKMNGYRIPELISLPYQGSPEALTNKTSL